MTTFDVRWLTLGAAVWKMGARGEHGETRLRRGKIRQAIAYFYAGADDACMTQILGHADVAVPSPRLFFSIVLREFIDDRRGVQMDIGRQQLYH